MALQMSMELDSDVTLPEAYIKITGYLCQDNDVNSVQITLGVYKNQQARIDGKPPFINIVQSCHLDPDAEGTTRGVFYEALKAQFYTTASDV